MLVMLRGVFRNRNISELRIAIEGVSVYLFYILSLFDCVHLFCVCVHSGRWQGLHV